MVFEKKGISMNNTRTVGRNIQLCMKNNNMDIEELSGKTGFSEVDIINLFSGRLMLSGSELALFSSLFGKEKSELLIEQDANNYKGLIHCMGVIDNQENVDEILDYIDAYISLEEDCMENVSDN